MSFLITDTAMFTAGCRLRKIKSKVYCKVGLATAAALFELKPNQEREVLVQIPFRKKDKNSSISLPTASSQWQKSLENHCELNVPDEHFKFLYDAALRTVILHSPQEVYPGPYTYRRFWFRDAAFILHAMLCAGLTQRVKKVLDCFPPKQTKSGYFHSQDGEWDSNGEALWIIRKFCEMTRTRPSKEVLRTINKAGLWISRKRLSKEPFSPHAGLLPAGFSAEHLGPNDYYYWDDFWGVAGLEAASYLENLYGNKERAKHFDTVGYSFLLPASYSLLVLLHLAVTGGFMVHTLLDFSITNNFKISFNRFGVSEMRYAVIILNIALIFFGKELFINVFPFIVSICFLALIVVVFKSQRIYRSMDMDHLKQTSDAQKIFSKIESRI